MLSKRTIITTKSAKTNSTLAKFLKNVNGSKRLIKFEKGAVVFSQGEAGKAVYFIQSGKIQLTVVSLQGKEAVLARLGPRDFMGEECLVARTHRTSTATALKASTIFRVLKGAMLRALRLDLKLSEEFMNSLLARNINLEEDLADQLFNHSEKRLAAALLKFTRRNRRDSLQETMLSKITHKTLAEIVGTNVAKIGVFMKKFRRLGLIDYRGSGSITVNIERLTEAVLHD